MEDAIINPQQRLVRVKEGALISGVCNGVSIRYGLPLSLIRLIYIVFTCLTLFIGGIAIYFHERYSLFLAIATLAPHRAIISLAKLEVSD